MTNLSHPNDTRRRGRGERGGVHEPHEDAAEIESSIEPVLGFGEVATRVLGKVEGMVGSSEGGLEVARRRVDGLELRHSLNS